MDDIYWEAQWLILELEEVRQTLGDYTDELLNNILDFLLAIAR